MNSCEHDRARKELPADVTYLFVHEQVGHEVLGLAGDVWPELVVEVNVAHLDTLQGLAVVLNSEGTTILRKVNLGCLLFHCKQYRVSNDHGHDHILEVEFSGRNGRLVD